MKRNAERRGFALVEVLLAAVVALGVVALLLVLAGDGRRLGRLGEDVGKLRRIGALTGEYGADHADKFWTFSWRKGQSHSQYPDLNNAPTDMQAGADQAVDILRRRMGREDIARITGWFAQITYSHLVLLDGGYCGAPEPVFISAADANRLAWSRDPAGFDAGAYSPAPSGVGTNSGKRWPYSSTFQLPTAYFDKSTVANRVSAAAHNQYFAPALSVFAGVSVDDVVFPASINYLSDTNARHFGLAQPYATHDEARLPVLAADGSVRVRAASESNPGWRPNAASSAVPSEYMYAPQPWEPPTISGEPQELVIGRFKWTRGMWAGRDFDGPEACTGQPGCP